MPVVFGVISSDRGGPCERTEKAHMRVCEANEIGCRLILLGNLGTECHGSLGSCGRDSLS